MTARRRSRAGLGGVKRRDVPGDEPRRGVTPAPLERGRAAGVLTGMLLFTVGFAVAAVLVAVGLSGTRPGYLVAITVGLVGVGVIGYYLNRGTTPLPSAPVWSPTMVRAVAEPLDLPAGPLAAVLYGLAVIGVVGNIVVPLLRG